MIIETLQTTCSIIQLQRVVLIFLWFVINSHLVSCGSSSTQLPNIHLLGEMVLWNFVGRFYFCVKWQDFTKRINEDATTCRTSFITNLIGRPFLCTTWPNENIHYKKYLILPYYWFFETYSVRFLDIDYITNPLCTSIFHYMNSVFHFLATIINGLLSLEMTTQITTHSF